MAEQLRAIRLKDLLFVHVLLHHLNAYNPKIVLDRSDLISSPTLIYSGRIKILGKKKNQDKELGNSCEKNGELRPVDGRQIFKYGAQIKQCNGDMQRSTLEQCFLVQ